MNRVIHIKRSRIRSNKKGITILANKSSNFTLFIPNSQIFNISYYKNPKGFYKVRVVITDFIFKMVFTPKNLKFLHEKSIIRVEGDRTFYINWDQVDERIARQKGGCFYCHDELDDKNKSKEHLVPRSLLKKIGYVSYKNNIVDCCKSCNGLKGNFSVRDFKLIIKNMIQESGDKILNNRLRRILRVLNKISDDGDDNRSKKISKE